jgi:hypothetical protein
MVLQPRRKKTQGYDQSKNICKQSLIGEAKAVASIDNLFLIAFSQP